MSAFADGLSQLRRYPSAVAGMLIIAALLGWRLWRRRSRAAGIAVAPR